MSLDEITCKTNIYALNFSILKFMESILQMQMEQRLSSVYKVKLGLLYPLAPIEGLPTVKLLKFITEICL
jgi:hypothetical protein